MKQTVDIVQAVALMGIGIGGVARDYKGASGAELADVNKRATEIAKKFALDGTSKISDEAAKMAGKYLKDYIPGPIKEAGRVKKLIEGSYGDISKGTFWSSAIAAKLTVKAMPRH